LTTTAGRVTLAIPLLILTTIRRLVLPLLVFLAWTPAAYAWSWPVQGPVLQPFSYDEAHPFAAGQHRGVDIGADAEGQTVVAPATGTVTFAGTVPTNGKSVTIDTADGYSVTLTHLGSIGVAKGAQVAEQDAIGTVGPSGTPEENGPYVHLGIRVATDPNGYVDPLGLLPAPAESGASSTVTTPAQPSSSSSGLSARTVRKPAKTRGSAVPARHGRVAVHEHERAQEPRAEAHPNRSTGRSAVRGDERARQHAAAPPGSLRRPVVETAQLGGEPTRLGAGHEIRPSAPALAPAPAAGRRPSNPLLELACNWVAALFAIGAALAADRRRRRSDGCPAETAQVLRLPPPAVERRHGSRAA
jgi:murein DD-endopeptidase MepM/ murein hydrolase activator NlpD